MFARVKGACESVLGEELRHAKVRMAELAAEVKIKDEALQAKETLLQAKEGRLHILGEMDKALAAPRADLSPYAPRIVTV